MEPPNTTKDTSGPGPILSELFRIGMWWRIVYGSLKLLLGLTLLRLVGSPLSEVFHMLIRHELTGDKDDFLIQLAQPLVAHFQVPITHFLAFYFIFWSIIDMVLSISLLRHKLWAFPMSIVLITLFVCYEVYRVFHTHSLILTAIIIIDIGLIFIINAEYRKLLNITPHSRFEDDL